MYGFQTGVCKPKGIGGGLPEGPRKDSKNNNLHRRCDEIVQNKKKCTNQRKHRLSVMNGMYSFNFNAMSDFRRHRRSPISRIVVTLVMSYQQIYSMLIPVTQYSVTGMGDRLRLGIPPRYRRYRHVNLM